MKIMKRVSTKYSNIFIGIFLILFASYGPESYSAIDLVTVPDRESVQLTIYNSADITMVREIRRLTFKRGHNRIQFSWAGTLIDPTSLRISFKEKKDKIDLLDTTFPPGNSRALQWNIKSEFNGPAYVQITYFTSGITWKADYVALTNAMENNVTLKGYVKVVNNSGEDYPNAKVRLIVGTINLVEKISDLARGYKKTYPSMSKSGRYYARKRFSKMLELAEDSKGLGSYNRSPKKIIKEGLSEYFLFTIEGKETVPNGWEKRLNSIYVENIPLKVIYRLSDVSTRGQVYKIYEFRNRKVKGKRGKGQLGESPLPDGRVYIFSEKKNKDLSYMGNVYIKYVANGDKVKINTGKNSDIKISRVLKNYKRTDIKLDVSYRKYHYVKSHKEHYYYETTLRNTLNRPVLLEIERRFGSKVKIASMPFKYEKVNYRTVKFYPNLRPNSKKVVTYHVTVLHGK